MQARAGEHEAQSTHGEDVQDLVRRVQQGAAARSHEAAAAVPRRAPSTVDLPPDGTTKRRRVRRWAQDVTVTSVSWPERRVRRWVVAAIVGASRNRDPARPRAQRARRWHHSSASSHLDVECGAEHRPAQPAWRRIERDHRGDRPRAASACGSRSGRETRTAGPEQAHAAPRQSACRATGATPLGGCQRPNQRGAAVSLQPLDLGTAPLHAGLRDFQ